MSQVFLCFNAVHIVMFFLYVFYLLIIFSHIYYLLIIFSHIYHTLSISTCTQHVRLFSIIISIANRTPKTQTHVYKEQNQYTHLCTTDNINVLSRNKQGYSESSTKCQIAVSKVTD